MSTDKEIPISATGFIETKYGKIHKYDIPYVQSEPFYDQALKVLIFYSIFIVVFIIIICVLYMNGNATQHPNQILRQSYQPHKINTIAKARVIKISNYRHPIPIEHIILIDVYDNVIDVDVMHNYFIKKHKVGQNGEMYEIDFGSEQTIKEIIVQLNPDKAWLSSERGLGVNVRIDLFDMDMNKSWNYNGFLTRKHNAIPIHQEVFVDAANRRPMQKNDNELLIINENDLAIKLTEFDETYDGY